MKKTGIELITQERFEQIEIHGYTLGDDAKFNSDGQLIYAASVLTINNADLQFLNPPKNWDVDYWFRLIRKSHKERLVIAGALIAAEIDRM